MDTQHIDGGKERDWDADDLTQALGQ